jgi:hypothetical protein
VGRRRGLNVTAIAPGAKAGDNPAGFAVRFETAFRATPVTTYTK